MDQTKSFWLDLFTWETWNELLIRGVRSLGFVNCVGLRSEESLAAMLLLCYLAGISRFVGALEVVGEPFRDTSPIWSSDLFPARLPVKVLIQLKAETAVPAYDLREQLSFFQASPDSPAWICHFRGPPNRFKEAEGRSASRNTAENAPASYTGPFLFQRSPLVNPR